MAGFTCADWTSSATTAVGQVGHSDGMGPNQNTAGALASWNSAHANQNCADTAPRGGGGKPIVSRGEPAAQCCSAVITACGSAVAITRRLPVAR